VIISSEREISCSFFLFLVNALEIQEKRSFFTVIPLSCYIFYDMDERNKGNHADIVHAFTAPK
jgi:hypothetical protein